MHPIHSIVNIKVWYQKYILFAVPSRQCIRKTGRKCRFKKKKQFFRIIYFSSVDAIFSIYLQNLYILIKFSMFWFEMFFSAVFHLVYFTNFFIEQIVLHQHKYVITRRNHIWWIKMKFFSIQTLFFLISEIEIPIFELFEPFQSDNNPL